MADKSNEFKLNSQNHEFSDRVNSIFGSLTETNSLSVKSEASPNKPKQAQDGFPSYKQRTIISHDKSYNRHDNRRFQNKRPSKPPDHVLRPEKYTKYSLKNDGTAKLSAGLSADALNKKIALDFINDIKQQKGKDEEITNSIEKSDDSKLRIKFSKRKPQETRETNSSSLFQSSHGGKARVMGTFEFGQKQTKEKKEKRIKSASQDVSSSIKLNYYDEEEEKEEEE